mgnify:CR=1 FL=1
MNKRRLTPLARVGMTFMAAVEAANPAAQVSIADREESLLNSAGWVTHPAIQRES